MKKSVRNITTKTPVKVVDAVIEVTDHGLYQLFDRYGFNTYTHIIDSEAVILYPDIDNGDIYYHNLVPTGYVVLRRAEEHKFVVVTITLLEHRNYGEPIQLINPILTELQAEDEI